MNDSISQPSGQMMLGHYVALLAPALTASIAFIVWLRGFLLQLRLMKCLKRRRPSLWHRLSRYRVGMQRAILVWRWVFGGSYVSDEEIARLVISYRKSLVLFAIMLICFALSLAFSTILLQRLPSI